MKKIKSVFIVIFSIFLILLASCNSALTITLTNGNPSFSYNVKPSQEFLKTVSAIMSFENSSEIRDFFDASELEKEFVQPKFTKVSSKINDNNEISVNFSPSTENLDPLSASGILKYDSNKKPYFEFSGEKFISFYKLMPSEFQSYIDMLMAPSFTGESMSDEEYLDFFASVYGQKLCDEIKNATIDFIFIDTGTESGIKKSKKSFSLLSILNITGKLIVKS